VQRPEALGRGLTLVATMRRSRWPRCRSTRPRSAELGGHDAPILAATIPWRAHIEAPDRGLLIPVVSRELARLKLVSESRSRRSTLDRLWEEARSAARAESENYTEEDIDRHFAPKAQPLAQAWLERELRDRECPVHGPMRELRVEPEIVTNFCCGAGQAVVEKALAAANARPELIRVKA
jgi:hypothetical protein